ncbi:MAG: cytochrome c [Gammaproteobacteria bacterium]|jgi:cytochrome c553|nr:cytochrome c [Gammaproteobacteria bacterium]
MKAILKSATLLILFSTNVFAADEYTGKEKAETCVGCHAIEGYNNTYPTYKVPKLGGQHADYIIAALKAYQKGDRKHETMHANASGLSDEDIQDIAKYFESIK